MKVETFSYNSVDELASNCYLLIDSKRKCVIIDPSVDYDGIVDFIINNKLTPVAILLTHGHYDHIKGVKRLVKRFSLPIYIHSLEVETLSDPFLNRSEELNIVLDIPVQTIEDGDRLKLLSDDDIIVIHTPYHTIGSVCYYLKKDGILFSGDTVFKMTIGRADLPTSTPRNKEESLGKIKSLPKETVIYPGHGRSTVLSNELAFNRFLMR